MPRVGLTRTPPPRDCDTSPETAPVALPGPLQPPSSVSTRHTIGVLPIFFFISRAIFKMLFFLISEDVSSPAPRFLQKIKGPISSCPWESRRERT